MKAITLTQPWATLVAIGAKQIETRSWSSGYRGPMAIHAAKGLASVGGKQGLVNLCRREPFRSTLLAAGILGTPALPMGMIVAMCDLVDCVLADTVRHLTILRRGDREWLWTENEKAFGDYTPGRYAWLLGNIKALPVPIPAKGALSLWEWNA